MATTHIVKRDRSDFQKRVDKICNIFISQEYCESLSKTLCMPGCDYSKGVEHFKKMAEHKRNEDPEFFDMVKRDYDYRKSYNRQLNAMGMPGYEIADPAEEGK